MNTADDYSVPRLLIFDTGPLWEYILYEAVYARGFARLRNERHFVTERADFDKLNYFISQYPNRVTTAHVIAEISHKIRNLKQAETERSRLWEAVHSVFHELTISEKPVNLSDMDRQIVARIGAIDAGLIRLGQRYSATRKRIFIEDQPFAAECAKAGLRPVMLSHLIEAADIRPYID